MLLATTNGNDPGMMLHAVWELHRRTRSGHGLALVEDMERALRMVFPERFRTTLIVQNSARRDGLTNLPGHIVTVSDDATFIHPPEYVRGALRLTLDTTSVKSLQAQGRFLLVHHHDGSAKIDRGQVNSYRRTYPEFDKCAISVVGNKCVAALYSHDGRAFPVLAFDGESGKQLWSKLAWGLGSEHLPMTGLRNIHVEIEVKDETVYVFGGDGSLFVDAFDLNSGADRFHFASNYWFAAEGRGR